MKHGAFKHGMNSLARAFRRLSVSTADGFEGLQDLAEVRLLSCICLPRKKKKEMKPKSRRSTALVLDCTTDGVTFHVTLSAPLFCTSCRRRPIEIPRPIQTQRQKRRLLQSAANKRYLATIPLLTHPLVSFTRYFISERVYRSNDCRPSPALKVY